MVNGLSPGIELPRKVSLPRSYSVAPPPRPTERSMARIRRVLASRTWESVDEVNAFMDSPQGQKAVEDAVPDRPIGLAQEKAYDAWETEGEARYRLAREALGIDERCSDAWLILAERERVWIKQRRCFEKAVAAADRAAREEGWLVERDGPEREGPEQEAPEREGPEREGPEQDGPAPELYGSIVGRPFLRARMALARFLMDGCYYDEARALYEEILRWDPKDHLGVRFEVPQIYHEMGDRQALRALVDRFSEDGMAVMAYERLWLALVEGDGEETVKKLERVARRANPYVPAQLAGRRARPDVDDDGYISVGREDEAAAYADTARRWWVGTPRTRAWLEEKTP